MKAPGVVTGRYGTIGQVFFIEEDFWPLNTSLYVRDFKGNNPKFVSFFLRTIDFNKYVDKAAVPGVNRNHLHMEHVRFPPIAEQQRISEILGALDQKIALNRLVCHTSEALVQAVFKSWFVDSDTHRSASGDACVLGDVLEITMGQSPPGSTYNEDGVGIPLFQGATDFGSLFPTNRVYCTAPTRVSREWDVLLSVRAPVGRTNLALSDCAIGRGVAALRHPKGHVAYTWGLVASVASALDVFNGEGTVFGSVNKRDLHNVVVPNVHDDAVRRFEGVGRPLLEQARITELESRTLAALRDTLLPRLISGDLRVGLPDSRASL